MGYFNFFENIFENTSSFCGIECPTQCALKLSEALWLDYFNFVVARNSLKKTEEDSESLKSWGTNKREIYTPTFSCDPFLFNPLLDPL